MEEEEALLRGAFVAPLLRRMLYQPPMLAVALSSPSFLSHRRSLKYLSPPRGALFIRRRRRAEFYMPVNAPDPSVYM